MSLSTSPKLAGHGHGSGLPAVLPHQPHLPEHHPDAFLPRQKTAAAAATPYCSPWQPGLISGVPELRQLQPESGPKPGTCKQEQQLPHQHAAASATGLTSPVPPASAKAPSNDCRKSPTIASKSGPGVAATTLAFAAGTSTPPSQQHFTEFEDPCDSAVKPLLPCAGGFPETQQVPKNIAGLHPIVIDMPLLLHRQVQSQSA